MGWLVGTGRATVNRGTATPSSLRASINVSTRSIVFTPWRIAWAPSRAAGGAPERLDAFRSDGRPGSRDAAACTTVLSSTHARAARSDRDRIREPADREFDLAPVRLARRVVRSHGLEHIASADSRPGAGLRDSVDRADPARRSRRRMAPAASGHARDRCATERSRYRAAGRRLRRHRNVDLRQRRPATSGCWRRSSASPTRGARRAAAWSRRRSTASHSATVPRALRHARGRREAPPHGVGVCRRSLQTKSVTPAPAIAASTVRSSHQYEARSSQLGNDRRIRRKIQLDRDLAQPWQRRDVAARRRPALDAEDGTLRSSVAASPATARRTARAPLASSSSSARTPKSTLPSRRLSIAPCLGALRVGRPHGRLDGLAAGGQAGRRFRRHALRPRDRRSAATRLASARVSREPP